MQFSTGDGLGPAHPKARGQPALPHRILARHRLRHQRLAKGHIHADIILVTIGLTTGEQPYPRKLGVQPDPFDTEPLGIKSHAVVNTPVSQ